MRSGDGLRRDVLRMASSAAYNVEKKQGHALSDDEMLGVLTREVKTRRESVVAFEGAGRQDLADKEAAEIEILSGYLPQALTDSGMTVPTRSRCTSSARSNATEWAAPSKVTRRLDGASRPANHSSARSRRPASSAAPSTMTTGTSSVAMLSGIGVPAASRTGGVEPGVARSERPGSPPTSSGARDLRRGRSPARSPSR